MSELALKLIEENKRKHADGEDATFLDLGNCGLTDELPEELFECIWLTGLNLGIYYSVETDDWVETFNKVAQNQLESKALGKLKSLVNLKELYLYKNQVSELKPLASLAALQTLNLSYNQASDLKPLASLSALQTLDLSYNQISDLKPLASLSALQTLELSYNQIKHFDSLLLQKWHELEALDLRNNNIANIPPAIFESRNCLSALKDYFAGIQKEAIPVYESKLILIGNGRVGKTCLVKRMLDGTFDADEPSTHAIQLREWPMDDLAKANDLKEIRLNIWDFGGQDIYHATHRVFMQTDAVFLLVWDEETEKTEFQQELLDSGKTITYKNYDLRYWLSYIKMLSNNSPVIIVETKTGNRNKTMTGLNDIEVENFNVIDCLAVESSKQTANGFGALKEKIDQVIHNQINTVCTTLPAQWHRVRKKVAEFNNGGRKSMPLQEFETLCKTEELNEGATNTLLGYLHDTGVLFYQKGLFGDQIIIDQKWAIDGVYKLFDRKGGLNDLQGHGRFSGKNLHAIWRDSYTVDEQALFLDFMLRCEVCFEINNDWQNKKPFEEREFIAPQLLPDEKPADSIANAFRKTDSIYIKYKHLFLHDAVIQRFIVRTGFIANNTDMWRQGILLRPADAVALIEAHPEKNEIIVRLETGQNQLADKINNELKEITEGEQSIETFYSLDGENYVSPEKLKKHPAGNEQIETENGNWVSFSDYRGFLNTDENIRFEKQMPSIVENMDLNENRKKRDTTSETEDKTIEELTAYGQKNENPSTIINVNVPRGWFNKINIDNDSHNKTITKNNPNKTPKESHLQKWYLRASIAGVIIALLVGLKSCGYM